MLAAMDRSDPAYRGQADYTPALLRLYDPLVLDLSASFVWRCPKPRLLAGYRRHVGKRHLDVGPGTGWFLDHAALREGSQLTLLDPNPTVLAYASQRLRRFDVTTIEADVLKPLPVGGPFDSAGLNFVLHCLPGPMTRKAAAVTNIAAVLAPTGTLFGSTVLGDAGHHNWIGRFLMGIYNRRGTFDNDGDTEDGLREILAASFETVELEVVNSVALFAARGPRPDIAQAAITR